MRSGSVFTLHRLNLDRENNLAEEAADLVRMAQAALAEA
jgi:hypothetical protein